MGREIIFTKSFDKEFRSFPRDIQDDILVLIKRYLERERLSNASFKTFSIEKRIKVQEFKIKDHTGNWRAISCLETKDFFTFVYTFHKKSQKLLEKDKTIIAKRVKEILK